MIFKNKLHSGGLNNSSAHCVRKRNICVGAVQPQYNLNWANKKHDRRWRTILSFVSSPCFNYVSTAGALSEVAPELMNRSETFVLMMSQMETKTSRWRTVLAFCYSLEKSLLTLKGIQTLTHKVCIHICKGTLMTAVTLQWRRRRHLLIAQSLTLSLYWHMNNDALNLQRWHSALRRFWHSLKTLSVTLTFVPELSFSCYEWQQKLNHQ